MGNAQPNKSRLSNPENKADPIQTPIPTWQIIVGFVFGVVFISIMLGVSIVIPEPTPTQHGTFKLVLALAAAGIGGILAGFIHIEGKFGQFFVKAGGALALFVAAYFYSPGLPEPVSGITLTQEQYVSILKEERDRARSEAETSSGKDKKILELTLQVIEGQLATKNTREEAYRAKIAYLEEQVGALKGIEGSVSDALIVSAKKALLRGDDSQADELFKQVEENEEGTIARVANAAYQRGRIAEEGFDYRKAFSHYQRAAQLQSDNPVYLSKAGELGAILGLYKDAIYWYEKSLASNLKTFDVDHPEVATNWNNLGGAWDSLGEYQKAIDYYEKALASNLKAFGVDHHSVATNWNNLGAAWESLGEYHKAIDYNEKSLASNLKAFGVDHHSVATNWNNLGSVWKSLGEYQKAIDYYEKSLASNLTTFGVDHPEVAGNWNSLGSAWYELGEYHKAIDYYEKSLASNLKTFGVDHHSVAMNWNNLGNAWKSLGEHHKAIDYYEKSLAIVLKTYGVDHPYVALLWAGLTISWHSLGEYRKAIGYIEKSLARNLKTLGVDHPEVATNWNNLGVAWYELGEYHKAIDYFEKVLLVYENKLGVGHPDIKGINKKIALARQSLQN